MASPAVPARPARSNQYLSANLASQASAPKAPPRPDKRGKDHSISPTRHGFDRSPLHGSLFATPPGDGSNDNNAGSSASDGTNRTRDAGYDRKHPLHSTSRKDAPSLRRPPSVSTLPSVGQEGNEYASLADEYVKTSTKPGVPEQTSVKQDLPLHAPKASVPSATAKSRISTVTRTDSTQAAAAGIGRPSSVNDEKGADSSRGGSRSASAAGGSQARDKTEHHLPRSGSSIDRPASSQSQKEEYEEQGIPEIGLQVPMYPNAGDVQAPTPSPFHQLDATGNRRHHMKRRSTREVFTGPPGSYGLHGHGVEPRDPFERAWYEKHPDQLEREGHGEYGPGINSVRSEWALSSNDLNKLVHHSAHRTTGLGASDEAIAQSTPDENIGYMASEEYARLISPRPQSSARAKRASSTAETPLRQSLVPEDIDAKAMEANEQAAEDGSDDEVIHIDPMSRRMSRVDDGLEQEADEQKEEPADYDDADENQAAAYSAPILAADEVAKYPEAEYMQPAVPPEWERAPTATYVDSDENNVLRRSGSRSSSRPNSFHAATSGTGLPMVKLMGADEHDHSSTPLEGIHEYEPLFPSDEEDEKKDNFNTRANGNNEKKRKMASRPKLDAHSHRFPSMDIWEDTPGSLQLQTVVATPQLPDDEDKSLSSVVARKPSSIRAFETPDAERQRKEQAGMTPEDRTSYLPSKAKAMADPRFKPGVLEEMHMQQQQQQQGRPRGSHRPGMQPRFPSRDVWEDTPDHFRLVTTVGGPQQSEDGTTFSATEPVPASSVNPNSSSAVAAATAKPSVPARPSRQKPQQDQGTHTTSSPVERTQHPALPDRPKPKLPARPAKLVSRESGEQSPLSRAMSADSDGSNGSGSTPTSAAPQTKPKPNVPPRPAGGVGNKIAALKAGFMSDLNSKLKMGPMAAVAGAVGAGAGIVAGARNGTESESADGAEDNDSTNKAVERAPPLDDARKGRARGPAGRRRAGGTTATTETASATAEGKSEAMSLSMSGTSVVWTLDDDGAVKVPSLPAITQRRPIKASANDETAANEASASSTEGALTPAMQDTTDSVDDKDASTIRTTLATGSAAVPVSTMDTTAKSASASPSPSLPASKMKMTSTAVQTGQIDISVPVVGGGGSGGGDGDGGDDSANNDTGKTTEEKMTVYIGGAAPESGNVVVKHGLRDASDERDAGQGRSADGDAGDAGSAGGDGNDGNDDDGDDVTGKELSSSVKTEDEVVVEAEDGRERVVKGVGERVC